MKRDDLKIGVAYYWDTSPDWVLPEYSETPTGTRATLLDAGRWRIDRPSWGTRSDAEPRPVSASDRLYRGAGVLVEVADSSGFATTGPGKTRRAVAQPGHLRGPYKETVAAVKEALDRRRKSRDADRARAAHEYQEAHLVVDALKAAGIRALVLTHGRYGTHHGSVVAFYLDDWVKLCARFRIVPPIPLPSTQETP